jgi:hypothetical protein
MGKVGQRKDALGQGTKAVNGLGTKQRLGTEVRLGG